MSATFDKSPKKLTFSLKTGISANADANDVPGEITKKSVELILRLQANP
jgi:hypothetical protein